MKKATIAIGMTCLLALGACSDTGNGAETSSEESSTSVNSEADGAEVSEEGDVAEEEADAGKKIMISESQADESEHEEGHGHGADVAISLENDEMDPAVLMTTITEGEEALTEANVRFEYWKEGEEKHTYTAAEENSEGMYEGALELSDLGTYKLKVHVEKGDELHTHKPYVLEVAEKE